MPPISAYFQILAVFARKIRTGTVKYKTVCCTVLYERKVVYCYGNQKANERVLLREGHAAAAVLSPFPIALAHSPLSLPLARASYGE